jgi:D-alanyl-D-alanine carboxypeptidase/D-alanyl-D-alanine-endopeptidase (penicillin-binding protein 4)
MTNKGGRLAFTTKPAPFCISLFLLFIPLFFCLLEPIPQCRAAAQAQEHTANKLLSLVDNGAVLLKKNANSVLAINPDQQYIPASIWKIATASTALFLLGPEYRFKTELFQTPEGDLFVKGYGDPFLVSEEIGLLSQELKNKLIHPIRTIYTDQSYFELTGKVAGAGISDNPYDAENFPLAVNFNTINIMRAENGSVKSAEPQTPNLPVMELFFQKAGAGPTRINISQDAATANRYSVELFSAILQGTPLKLGELPRQFQKHTPSNAKHILTHLSSKTLLHVVEEMFQYSNNFIANQVFLTCGAEHYGSPATWEKARRTMSAFLTDQIGLPKKSFTVSEGSGLSRNNRISAGGMVALLEYFRPYFRLLPRQKGGFVKSGTLTGVYSYAGYLLRDNEQLPFAIILNQKRNNRDRILDQLKAFNLF